MRWALWIGLAAILACDRGPAEPHPDADGLTGRWRISGHASAALPPDQSLVCEITGDVDIDGTIDTFNGHGTVTVQRTFPGLRTEATYTIAVTGTRMGFTSAAPVDLALVLDSVGPSILSGRWRCGVLVSTIYRAGGPVETDSAVAQGSWTLTRRP
jgi:hypothetical protein